MESAQILVLTCMGFIPYVDRPTRHFTLKGSVRAIPVCLAIALLLGTTAKACLVLALVLRNLLYPQEVGLNVEGKVGLLAFFEDFPECVMGFRSLTVLGIFFFNRKQFQPFTEAVNHWLGDHSLLLERIKDLNVVRWSYVLLLGTFAAQFLWVAMDWARFLIIAPNVNITSNNILAPFPEPLLTWQYIVIDVVFMALPFALSQQVYIFVLVSVTSLLRTLRCLDASLANTLTTLSGENQQNTWKQLPIVRKRLEEWKDLHLRIAMVTDRINELFGSVMFVTFGADVLLLVCVSSRLVTDTIATPLLFCYKFASVVLFGVYVTCFPMPMVKAYETSSALALKVQQLSYLIQEATDESPMTEKVWTFLITFVIIAKQVLGRDPVVATSGLATNSTSTLVTP
ncbi:hypothetical protein BV898_17980 [Hypsibius exemplaris]|uniref:Uncharacterized protein n=1 Tax=Hypsibius exemplaris TaxID=2072580 RepID=A0A9X6RN28_HYPEX|nr:hypothetical protein BV898_17980 [Hypsibius exemplaris]